MNRHDQCKQICLETIKEVNITKRSVPAKGCDSKIEYESGMRGAILCSCSLSVAIIAMV